MTQAPGPDLTKSISFAPMILREEQGHRKEVPVITSPAHVGIVPEHYHARSLLGTAIMFVIVA